MLVQFSGYLPNNIFNIPSQVTDRVTALFRPYQPLERRIDFFATQEPTYQLSAKDVSDLKEACQKANRFFSGALKEKLANLPEDFMVKFMAEGVKDDMNIDKWLSYCISFLKDNEDAKSIMETQALLKDDMLKSVLKTKARVIFRELVPEFFYFVHHILDLAIGALGLREVGPERSNYMGMGEGSYGAKAKLDLYLAILLYPSTIFAVCYENTGSVTSALLFTTITVVASVIFLICYDRYLKPCPKDCYGLENITQRLRREENDPILERTDILQQIENAFKAGKGVLLSGPTGVGKTKIVEAFVQKMIDGRCADWINKAQMFEGHPGSINSLGMDSISFPHVMRQFERHKKEAFFFFDEFHTAFEDRGINGNSSSGVKTFCNRFKYVIGATDQMDKFNNDPAIMRRFTVIEVKPVEKDELERALYNELHHKNLALQTEAGVMNYIIEKARGRSKIDASISLLRSAVDKASEPSFDQLIQEKAELEAQKDLEGLRILHGGSRENYQQIVEAFRAKEKELQEKERQVERLKKIEEIYLYHFKKSFQITNETEWQKNEKIVRVLKAGIAKQREDLGLPVKLSKELIDQILSANMNNRLLTPQDLSAS